MSKREEKLAKAYKQLCKELSAALYEEDPSGMGSSVGAPMDEYDGEAARVAAALRDSRPKQEIAMYLKETFGDCSQTLLVRVERAVSKFRIKAKTAALVDKH